MSKLNQITREINRVLKLPVTDYLRLKKSLNILFNTLGVDRCSLLFLSDTDPARSIVPIEVTHPDFPGAKTLKTDSTLVPIFEHIAHHTLSSEQAVAFNKHQLNEQKVLYDKYVVKSQLSCKINLADNINWVLVVQQCRAERNWSAEEQLILSHCGELFKSVLAHLTDITSLLSATEYVSEMVDNSPLAQVVYNMDRKLVYANKAYCKLNERSLEDIVLQSAEKFLTDDDKHLFKEHFDQTLRNENPVTPARKIRGDGKVLYIENRGELISLRGKKHYLITCENITEKIQARDALQESLDIQKAILESTDDGIMVENTAREVILCNRVFLNAFNLSPDLITKEKLTTLELLAKGMPEILNADEILEKVTELVPGSSHKTDILVYLKNGDILEYLSFPLLRNNEIQGRTWYFKDITEKHQLTEKLSFDASHDVLTHLLNRRGFEKKLRDVIADKRNSKPVHALLYLDLDRFKIINDTCGHNIGDIALKEVSALLSSNLRESDTLARVGGDEFCILLEKCPTAAALKVTDQIRQSMADYMFVHENKEYDMGVSIGVITLDETIKSYEQALNLADTSCYIAKEKGHNSIHAHTVEDGSVLLRLQENKMVNKIQAALRNHRFSCYVQEIFPTNTNSNPGHHTLENNHYYEILVRMSDSQGNVALPNTFLATAERYKYIHKIDHWVITESITQFAPLQEKIGWISINLSGQTISHADTFRIILKTIKSSGMAPEKICFEITETAAITNYGIGLKFINAVRDLGCLIALDDFGTGLSSYEYLKRLPADIVKIDGQFIRNILKDKVDLSMVKSINEIAHIMGKKTVGEYVEDALSWTC